MRTIAYLEPETGRVMPPIAPHGMPYGGNGLALVSALDVDRLRTAAATLNEAICTGRAFDFVQQSDNAGLLAAVLAWRRAWLEVDGKHLAIGDLIPARAEPIRSARAFQRRR